MKCKCSLNNSYEVIGFCDLEKFNAKINKFSDKSWTQIIIPETLTLPKNKASIKNITKVYLDIKITSTKIIQTPSSDIPSVEGLKLTGKLLLVSGKLCQNIIYISDTLCNSVHSAKFTIPFNTHIVIEEDADLENDSYCVYPCVEDVIVRPVTPRTISKSVTLFLFAHRIASSINIPNKFIFYNYTGGPVAGNEIVTVSFSGCNTVLIATSSGNTYGAPPPASDFFLQFELNDSNASITRALGRVPRNQDGTDFVTALNDQSFEIDDLIAIAYSIQRNTILTDYPFPGDIYDMSFFGPRIFKITRNGIIPHVVPNVIVLNSQNNNPLVTIAFDIHSKVFLSQSLSNERTDPNFSFDFILKDSSGAEKFTRSLGGNQSGNVLSRALSVFGFEFNDIIEIIYNQGDKIEIKDNPYPTSTGTILSGQDTKSYSITETALVPIP